MEIITNLWQVGGDGLTGAGDAAIYLVRFGNHAALIDAGCGSGHQQLTRNIAACLPPEVKIDYLFLTHCHFDHTGGAAAVRDTYGCRIVAHERDAVYLESGDRTVTAAAWYGTTMPPLTVDQHILENLQTFNIGGAQLTAHHCPGHSPGSMVMVTEIEKHKVLFGQDIHGPLHDDLLSDRRQYRHSLKFIMDLQADILCEGHFGVYRGKGSVRQFIGSYLAAA
jgi:glyoxylase-like metal-dependent hydrolase (beta-lactamase superfamily II)